MMGSGLMKDTFFNEINRIADEMIKEWKNPDRSFIIQNGFCKETKSKCKNLYDRAFFHDCEYCKIPTILCNNCGNGGLMGTISASEGLNELEGNQRIHYKIKKIPPILKIAMLMGLHDLKNFGQLTRNTQHHIRKVIEIYNLFFKLMNNTLLSRKTMNSIGA
jgi:hypothetical protein